MKSSTLPVLAALAATLAGAMLVAPQAEASRRGASGGISSIGQKSGPGTFAMGVRAAPVVRDHRGNAGPVVRDHRGTAGKLQCQGPYCSPSKKSIVDGVKAPIPGKATQKCYTYEGPWCRAPRRPHGH
jgi:hypothetical protein